MVSSYCQQGNFMLDIQGKHNFPISQLNNTFIPEPFLMNKDFHRIRTMSCLVSCDSSLSCPLAKAESMTLGHYSRKSNLEGRETP